MPGARQTIRPQSRGDACHSLRTRFECWLAALLTALVCSARVWALRAPQRTPKSALVLSVRPGVSLCEDAQTPAEQARNVGVSAMRALLRETAARLAQPSRVAPCAAQPANALGKRVWDRFGCSY